MAHDFLKLAVTKTPEFGCVSAGQTVFHVPVHLIPRRDGDVADPRGGVRGVIPSEQRY